MRSIGEEGSEVFEKWCFGYECINEGVEYVNLGVLYVCLFARDMTAEKFLL